MRNKVFATMLAVIMLFGSCLTAFAATPFDIRYSNKYSVTLGGGDNSYLFRAFHRIL